MKNITSVTVGGQIFNAAGRWSMVLIDPAAGLINMNARDSQIFMGDGEALTLIVRSNGYPDYAFTLAVDSHTIGVKSTNGTTVTGFTVLEKKADDSSDPEETKKDTDKMKNSEKNSSKKTTGKKSAKTGDENSAGL